jgi:Pretoxin HINT domain
LVEVATNVPGEEGAGFLVRLAVDAPDAYVREKAAEALQERPYPTYVPVLIAGLAAPMELSFTKSVQPGGTEFERVRWYEYTGRLGVGLYDKYRLRSQYTNRDVLFWGPEVQHKSGLMISGHHPDRVQYNYQLNRESPDPAKQYEYAGTLEGDERSPKNARKAPTIEDLDKRVKEINEKQARLNERIDAALSKATGAEVESQARKDGLLPQKWWEWWRRHSGMNRYFARGTEVWTQTGPVAIEQVLVGDRVLSRDPKSGDVSFRLVIGIGEQVQGEMRIVDVDARTIVATPDQPFMVAVAGWRNAADLKAGMKLEGLGPKRSIGGVRAGDGANMYNLIVADMPNFFVDRSGILVHDASNR